MERTDVIQSFIDGRGLESYLEIGIRSGHTFLRIRAPRKVAVDPAPQIGLLKLLRWRFRNPTNLGSQILRVTSNEFFDEHTDLLDGVGLDVAFVDGLHTYDQSLQDVERCLEHLNPGGVILMHDCSPPTAAAATPAMSPDESRAAVGDDWHGMWCGDVYKTILHLRSRRKDLRVCVLDCDRGIGVVQPGAAESLLNLSADDIRNLGFAELDGNRREWLDLRPPESLSDLVDRVD